MRGQRLRLARARAAEAGVGQEEGTLLLLLLLLEAMFLHLSVQTIPLLLGHATKLHSVSGHAQSQTFLQTAVLAAVAARSVDQTVFLARTRVGGVTLLTPPEETLTALAGDHPVVYP